MVLPATQLARRARVEHGLISWEQALACGMSPAGMTRAVRSGRLERVHPGVYRVAGAPETWEQRALAAVLASGGVVSHRSAARVWGLLDTDIVEVTGRRVQGVTAHESSDLDPRHRTRRGRLPITNPMRTLVDLGAVLPGAVPDALERALIDKLCSLAGVERALDDVARRGRAGAGPLRAALDHRALGATRADGMLEPRLARLIRDYGLPMPVFQYQVGRIARVDAAYPERKLAIEVDGFEVHGTPSAFRKDLERQNRLVAAGWTILRFTWWDVIQAPHKVAAALALQLAA
ncbi:MAG TPA: type IV toxin-antitoxin system AbiEi family antitoxin domain-containing protein [Acidimicrobiales bacterium]|nr:type IV toxin-antitoxin system AbiEi family antitoxin domain-containing protein [Acidimicrobiales bacterium]